MRWRVAAGPSRGDNPPMPGIRSLLLVRVLEDEGGDDAAAPSVLNTMSLGTVAGVIDTLTAFNTAPDGAPDTRGVLHGPGIVIQLPMATDDDPVNQLLVSINEEDIAWPVLVRICRELGWKMMDPSTGRTFG